MKRLLYILPFLFAALVSCEREITYHGEYDDPKLVVQAILYAGEDSIDCFVDRSYFFLDKKPNTKEPLSDAIIQIESASNPSLRLVRLSPVGACYRLYLSEPLQTNDTIRLSVTHPEYGTATAEEVIVPRFKVQLKSSVWDTKKCECRAVFDFPDSPNLSNSLNVTAIVRWNKVHIYTVTKMVCRLNAILLILIVSIVNLNRIILFLLQHKIAMMPRKKDIMAPLCILRAITPLLRMWR